MSVNVNEVTKGLFAALKTDASETSIDLFSVDFSSGTPQASSTYLPPTFLASLNDRMRTIFSVVQPADQGNDSIRQAMVYSSFYASVLDITAAPTVSVSSAGNVVTATVGGLPTPTAYISIALAHSIAAPILPY